MNYHSYIVPVILLMCTEILCSLPERKENQLDKRAFAYQKPEPVYAKASCTSYPGRVVCQLGRYTFVINNGEHEMDPEIIERFAAMIYHRSQEGDANFDVSVDFPAKINEEYLIQPQKPPTDDTKIIPENSKAQVYVECSPISDDRKLSEVAYSPTEVVYSCKRRDPSLSSLRGIEKRMIISVDREGTVSAGDLILPYTALLDKRFKRYKIKDSKRSASIPIETTINIKVFSNVCASSQQSWCPKLHTTICPEQCVQARFKDTVKGNNLENMPLQNQQPIYNVIPVAKAVQTIVPDIAMDRTIAPLSENTATLGVVQQVKQGVIVPMKPVQSMSDVSISPKDSNQEASLYAISRMPPPVVRVYTDICEKVYKFPWCPVSYGPTECTISGCVTLPECQTRPKIRKRRRRDQNQGKKVICPGVRHRLNMMRTSRRLGQKRIYMKRRKRQAKVSSMCTTTCTPPPFSCVISCKPQTTVCPVTTECAAQSIFFSKRELKRKSVKTIGIQRCNTSRERYILE